jgi:hypothetical protein
MAPAVAVSIGVTVFERQLDTYTVLPSGVMARLYGSEPTGTGVSAVQVAVSIGGDRAFGAIGAHGRRTH